MKRLLPFVSSLLFAAVLPAAENPDAVAFFEKEIAPIFRENCFKCHSHDAGKAKGGLVLDSRTGWMTGGDSGPAIAPGNPEASLLIEAVRYGNPDLEMPPDGKLPAPAIAALEKWIADGAHDPREGSGFAEDGTEQVRAEDLWSLQPVEDVTPPNVEDPAWSKTAIDRFVRARLDEAGLPPTKPAPDAILLRRMHLTLTGLPPTRDDLAEFDGNVEAAVDELLNSPAFGEKWARHWLDLTAYADTVGVGRAIPALEAWRYRDYVIEAFNADKPFTEFILQQLAGDIQVPSAPGTPRGPEPTAESIVATGFLAIGPWELVGGDKEQLRMDVIDKQIHRTGQVFLGMTLGCARCHDHKFDPVSQKDYYAMAGIFKSTVTLKGRMNGVFSAVNHVPLPESPEELMARAERMKEFRAEVEKSTRLREEANARAAELKRQIEAEQGEISEDTLAQTERMAELAKERDAAEAEAKKQADRLKSLEYLKRHRTESLAMAVTETPEPETCRINIRGNAHQLGDPVPRGFLSEVAPKDRLAFTRGGSGRVQLAEWIASEENPLTARVWVNRVWYHLLGAGLVRTVDNFGARGESPSHPELLDYLAAEFMREGWSTKQLIRRILLSQTWQQDSVNQAALANGAKQRDPENRLLWRANRRRLEAEAIRDSMLFASGLLNEDRGGPALPVDIPGNLNTGGPGSMKESSKIPAELEHRRTIYLPQKRKAPFDEVNFIGAFDLPDTDQETGRRTQTAVPTQALYLVNSPFVQECGKALADRFENLPAGKRLREIYLALYCREPSPEELDLALSFLQDTERGLQEARPVETSGSEIHDEAWARLCQSLLISNEFLFWK